VFKLRGKQTVKLSVQTNRKRSRPISRAKREKRWRVTFPSVGEKGEKQNGRYRCFVHKRGKKQREGEGMRGSRQCWGLGTRLLVAWVGTWCKGRTWGGGVLLAVGVWSVGVTVSEGGGGKEGRRSGGGWGQVGVTVTGWMWGGGGGVRGPYMGSGGGEESLLCGGGRMGKVLGVVGVG